MNRLKLAGLLSVWGSVVFGVVFMLTFPSEEVGDFASEQVSQATKGAWGLSVDGVSPAMIGASASSVTVLQRSDDAMAPFVSFDKVSAATSVFDAVGMLLGGDGEVGLSLVAEEEELALGIRLTQGDDGVLHARGVYSDGGLPLVSLPAIGGVSVQGEGRLLLDTDLTWEDGFSSAQGMVNLTGDDITVSGLSFLNPEVGEMVGDIDAWPLDISKLQLQLAFDDGKVTVKRGKLKSDWLEVAVSGTITLADDPTRSRANLKFVITYTDAFSDLPFAALVTATQKSALHKDGDYHYTWNTGFKRISKPRPDREKMSSRAKTKAQPNRTRKSEQSGRGSKSRPQRKSRMDRKKGIDRQLSRTTSSEESDDDEEEEDLTEEEDEEEDEEEEDEESEEDLEE